MRINNGGSATIPSTQATDVEVATAVSDHAALADPHTGYRLESADHTHLTTGLQGGQLGYGHISAVAASDYAPTVTQSGLLTSYTTQVGHYIQLGKLVFFWGKVVVNNATGAVANNAVVISLPPVAARVDQTVFSAGVGSLYDLSATIMYRAVMALFGANSFVLSPASEIGVDGTNFYLGAKTFVAILQTGDIITFSGQYEAA